jgi:hypothetical protein
MRDSLFAIRLVSNMGLVFAVAAGGTLCAQQIVNPLGQMPTPQKTQSPSKPKEQTPKKDEEPPDPTKDPAKDPAKDITRDPTKEGDPSIPPVVSPDETDAQDIRGADQQMVATEAPDYTGPSVLSRGFVLSRPSVPTNEIFRAFVGVNAIYDSVVSAGSVPNGQGVAHAVTADTAGIDLDFGISGKHYRRKDIFELGYEGHVYEYADNNYSGGQNHSLSVGYTREFTPHFSVGIREIAGLYTNSFGLLNSVAISDISLSSSTIGVAPNTLAFNNQTYFSTTVASVIYQKSARLSFSVSAAAYFVTYDSPLLANSHGGQYAIDTAYRLTRRQTFGAYYTHNDFQYTKILSNTHSDTFGATYSAKLSPTVDFSAKVGVTHLATQGLAVVAVNPTVSSLLGIENGIEKFYLVTLAPDFTVTLARHKNHTNMSLAYVNAITPGNGLVLTSRRQSASGSWEYAGFRKYSLQAVAGWDELLGYVNTVGAYGSYYGRVSASRMIGRDISSILTFDYRQQSVALNGVHQKELRISFGFRYTPPSELLRF